MMKFLEDCQFLLKMCGYCAYDTADTFRYRWSHAINQFLAFWHIYFLVTCIIFVCDDRQPLDERIYLTMSVVAFMEQAGAHFTITAQKANIFEFFKHFEILANERSIDASQKILNFYLRAEQKTTAIKDGAKSYLLMPYNVFLIVPFALTVIQKIIIEKCASDPITWHVPLKANVPFERNSVHGYLYYNFISFVCVYHYFGLLIIYAQLFLGMCFYLNAFCQDFAISIRNINKWRVGIVEHAELLPPPRDCIEFDRTLNKEICKAIDFQAEIIDYYTLMNEILNGIILSNMAGGAIFCAISVQQTQAASQHIDLDFVTCLVTVFISLLVIFPYCYAATIAFESVQTLNASVFNTIWFKLPVKYQYYVKIMLMPAQSVRELSGYSLIDCSLETFRKILRLAGSLYIMINSM